MPIPNYGAVITTMTFGGRVYDHSPCCVVDYELPAEVLAKLDARFGKQTKIDPLTTPKCKCGCGRCLHADDVAAGRGMFCNH